MYVCAVHDLRNATASRPAVEKTNSKYQMNRTGKRSRDLAINQICIGLYNAEKQRPTTGKSQVVTIAHTWASPAAMPTVIAEVTKQTCCVYTRSE